MRDLAKAAMLALAEAAAVVALLFAFLAGWQRDFRAPVYFSYDALEYLMQVKGTLENGWWWVHPRLGAPGVFEQIQYPSNSNVDQGIVWLVGCFTENPALAINLSWMIMVALSALVASRCATLLGVPRRIAICAGILFALSPYALSRNVDHFSLATYLVPIPCTVALLVATGRLADLPRSSRLALVGGCVLIGFNYTYYAFFAGFLLLVASLIAFAAEWNYRALGRGLLFVGIICAATAVNLAPSLYAWGQYGRPGVIPDKHAAEAEQYGLKIRQLVSPVPEHDFPPFRHWTDLEKDAQFPLETENRNGRLGLVATVGFLALLCGFFIPRLPDGLSDRLLFINAGRLTLAALLLATVGGFGSLFSLLVSPEIRAYARLTPFLSFFSLLAIALILQRFLSHPSGVSRSGRFVSLALAATLALGLYDQSQTTHSLNREQEGIREEWHALGDFVQALESRLPGDAMVFQLPVLAFLSETGRERMLPLDHIKPYLVSNRVRWSFPALSDPVVRWQQQVGRLPAPALATALERQGFAAILVDRYGYADRAKALLEELGAAGVQPKGVLVSNERYVALDLRSVQKLEVPPDRLPALGAQVTAASAGVAACGTQPPAHNLEWIGGASAPFASPPRISRTDEFYVVGWALDERSGRLAGDVDIVIDEAVFPANYGIDRPDVADYFGASSYRESGFRAKLAGADVGPGIRSLSIRILAADRSCYYEGQKTQIVAQ